MKHKIIFVLTDITGRNACFKSVLAPYTQFVWHATRIACPIRYAGRDDMSLTRTPRRGKTPCWALSYRKRIRYDTRVHSMGPSALRLKPEPDPSKNPHRIQNSSKSAQYRIG